ncbi:MAG: hypothetical protein A2231_10905 [Candidatus Firestonebacteria bacterium RIFOXYA2_FULL_40_8]|nr:MAG: hypothetical protein A2231_10905 [Candidatus Firestonebacteria bacterium RIFOXYA2_FULL_40_8]
MQPWVDEEKCIGCSACAAVAPKSFQIKDNNKAQALEPAEDTEEIIQAAADSCPTGAISLK